MALTHPHRIPGKTFTIAPRAWKSGLALSGSLSMFSGWTALVLELHWLLIGVVLGCIGCLIVLGNVATTKVIISHGTVIVERGILNGEAHFFAFRDVRPYVRQTILDRLLGTGTVCLRDAEREVQIPFLGEVDRLKAVLADRIGISRIQLETPRRRP
jgi:hypothetical protein